jgi:hypothetical protein
MYRIFIVYFLRRWQQPFNFFIYNFSHADMRNIYVQTRDFMWKSSFHVFWSMFILFCLSILSIYHLSIYLSIHLSFYHLSSIYLYLSVIYIYLSSIYIYLSSIYPSIHHLSFIYLFLSCSPTLSSTPPLIHPEICMNNVRRTLFFSRLTQL